MYWRNFFRASEEALYLDFVAEFLCVLIIILYLFSERKNIKLFNPLIILVSASLIQGLFANYLMLTNATFNSKLNRQVVLIYITIEITCCLKFIKTFIASKIAKAIIGLGNLLFILLALTYCYLNHVSVHSLFLVQLIEGFLVIAACLFYFYENLLTQVSKPTSNRLAFWTISAMLVLFSALTPIVLLITSLIKTQLRYLFPNAIRLFAITYVGYIIFFSTLGIVILKTKKNLYLTEV